MRDAALKRTPEQFRAYLDAVVKPDMAAGGDARARHTLSKEIVTDENGNVSALSASAFIGDTLVIWKSFEESCDA